MGCKNREIIACTGRSSERNFFPPTRGATGEKSFLELRFSSEITGAADAHGGGPVTGKLRTTHSCGAAAALGPQAELAVKTTPLTTPLGKAYTPLLPLLSMRS